MKTLIAFFVLLGILFSSLLYGAIEQDTAQACIQREVNNSLGSFSLSALPHGVIRRCLEVGNQAAFIAPPAPCLTMQNLKRYCVRNGLVSQE